MHIGMPKTGTTLLQQVIFRNHSDISYLGKNSASDELNRAGAAIVRLNSTEFNFYKTRATFETALGVVESDKPFLLSDEDLSRYAFLDPELMATRLHSVLGDYYPLYIIRSPLDWLQSIYFFRLFTLNHDALLGPAHWLNKNLMSRGLGSDTADLHYGRIASAYRRLSGSDSINIICYEDLKTDSTEYLRKISTFVEMSADRSLDLYKTASRDKMRDKVRINQSQADFLLGCGALVSDDVGTFSHHIEQTLCDLVEGDLQVKISLQVKNLIDQGVFTLDAWKPVIRSILVSLDTVENNPAQFQIPLDLEQRVQALIKREMDLDSSLPKDACRAYGYFK